MFLDGNFNDLPTPAAQTVLQIVKAFGFDPKKDVYDIFDGIHGMIVTMVPKNKLGSHRFTPKEVKNLLKISGIRWFESNDGNISVGF